MNPRRDAPGPGPSRVDWGLAAAFALLNVLVHFLPFERPGFQPDDYTWLARAHAGAPWSFVDLSLSQPTRPLGWLLYMLMPRLVGLQEAFQLAILVGATTLLTLLVQAFLTGCLPRPLANLATLAFVVWPVKHEIYASQLFGVIAGSAAMIVGAGLLYRRWARTSSPGPMALALVLYGLAILTYEVGYLAPLVFYLTERRQHPGVGGLSLFAIPACLPWINYAIHAGTTHPMGNREIGLMTLLVNLVTSLPSNLLGFQLARNLGYGWWGFVKGPVWFQLAGAGTAMVCGLAAWRWILEARNDPAGAEGRTARTAAGFLCAALLALPAAIVLVESRHSVLASASVGVVVSSLAARFRPAAGVTAILALLVASQGLALRQTEVSRLQAAVHHLLEEQREEIRAASVVVVDMASLADRVSYTWGKRDTNVLRAYWGIHAFAEWGLAPMIAEVLRPDAPRLGTRVMVCAVGLVISDTEITCARNYGPGPSFRTKREHAWVVDFTSLPLPTAIQRAVN